MVFRLCSTKVVHCSNDEGGIDLLCAGLRTVSYNTVDMSRFNLAWGYCGLGANGSSSNSSTGCAPCVVARSRKHIVGRQRDGDSFLSCMATAGFPGGRCWRRWNDIRYPFIKRRNEATRVQPTATGETQV